VTPPDIYLDNAASTRVAPEVAQALAPYFSEHYGNPSSLHRMGIEAERAVKQARLQVAHAVGAAPEQVFFTSGGTEANALGVLGAPARGRGVVVSALEHPSVVGSAKLRGGESVRTVAVSRSGVVDADAFAGACSDDVAVAACMLVSNELGTVQPIAEIAARLRTRGFRGQLHVDAVQALGKLPIRLGELGADSIALASHKIHGPKGVGAIVVRPGVTLRPLWGGGKHEAGVRPGTENVPGIVGFGHAAELAAQACQSGAMTRIAELRDRLCTHVTACVPGARVACADSPRAPHIAALVFPGVLAEPLLHALEARGIFVSAGSACHSHERGPQPVAALLGLGPFDGMIRVSLARTTTSEEIDQAARAIPEAVREARL
jgi:cysteine desulfurase